MRCSPLREFLKLNFKHGALIGFMNFSRFSFVSLKFYDIKNLVKFPLKKSNISQTYIRKNTFIFLSFKYFVENLTKFAERNHSR
jgi:hypothetical protein